MTPKKPTNDLVLLDSVLAELSEARPQGLTDAEFFEFFTFDQILKNFDLSADELLDGQLGGGDEGGIDGMFAFADDRLIDENSDLAGLRRGVELSIHIIQSKREQSFTETAVQKMADSVTHLLDLGVELDELDVYHDRFKEKAEIVRQAIKRLANKRPTVKVTMTYATKGDSTRINSKVETRAALLVAAVEDALQGAEVRFSFLGARNLYVLSQRAAADDELELAYHRDPQSDGKSGYIALVDIEEYFRFITEPSEDDPSVRELRRYIFDANVRDLERSTVNEEIFGTLKSADAPQFWWLNNGVTIVCSKVRIMNERFFLEDPLVVNGLQSSMVLFDYFTGDTKPSADGRLLLTRIIQSTDPKTRDQVIRATNRQTPVSDATLRATDDVQRDIERFFLSNQWYYERRKNLYRNQGKPAERVVAIPYLAQAIMSIGLSRPNDARARPSSLLKDDSDYRKIFNKKYPLAVYLWAARTQRAVDAFLRSDEADSDANERTNLRFYLAMLVVALARGQRCYSPAELADSAERSFTVDEMKTALAKVRTALAEFQEEVQQKPERVVKGPGFVLFLLDKYVPRDAAA
jgi:hypothetical protein